MQNPSISSNQVSVQNIILKSRYSSELWEDLMDMHFPHYRDVLNHLKTLIEVMRTLSRENIGKICRELEVIYDVSIFLSDDVEIQNLEIFHFKFDNLELNNEQ